MTILVTGSTGTIGSQIVQRLAGAGSRVRALARDTAKARVPAGVEPVQGDMSDVASMREALQGVDTLFLLNAVIPDETTQALVTLDLAREAGIQRIVYFSVFNSTLFDDVPHFAGKHLVERVIDTQAIPATVLRPAYFMQNDLMFKDALEAGAYPQPIGGIGLAMVDARDIADAAAAELLRRERAPHPLPRTTMSSWVRTRSRARTSPASGHRCSDAMSVTVATISRLSRRRQPGGCRGGWPMTCA